MPCSHGPESRKRIILFNGPPGCGKDTAANIIHEKLITLSYKYKMAQPLKEACHKLLGLEGTLEELESVKELPIKFLVTNPSLAVIESGPLTNDVGEMTLRQFYIHVSENMMKPLFGNDVFGRSAVEYLRQTHQIVSTVSDAGFVDEVQPIIDYFGEDRVCLVRIHRTGKTFKGDSRKYVDLPLKYVMDIHNDNDLDAFADVLWRKISKNFLNGIQI